MKRGNRNQTPQEGVQGLDDLANRVDSDTGNLSRVETGKQGASEETLRKIAGALGCSVADLFAGARWVERVFGCHPDAHAPDTADQLCPDGQSLPPGGRKNGGLAADRSRAVTGRLRSAD